MTSGMTSQEYGVSLLTSPGSEEIASGVCPQPALKIIITFKSIHVVQHKRTLRRPLVGRTMRHTVLSNFVITC